MVIEGHLLAPGAAARHRAQLQLGPDGQLALQSQAFSSRCRLEQVKLSDALGRLARTLTFPEGWVFVPADGALLNQWLKAQGKQSWVARLERHVGAVLVSMVLILLAGWGTYRYLIPASASLLAGMVPQKVYQLLGEQSQTLLDHAGFHDSELEQDRRDQLQQRFSALLGRLDKQGVAFTEQPRLRFYQFEGGANAFALTDGTVVLTDEIVALADDDAELDGVLLHELGHIHHHHAMTQLVQGALFSVATAVLVGDSSAIADNLAGAAVFFTSMSYSRDHEREADAFAADLLRLYPQGTEPLRALYLKLKGTEPKGEGLPAWASTHPDLDERIAALAEADH